MTELGRFSSQFGNVSPLEKADIDGRVFAQTPLFSSQPIISTLKTTRLQCKTKSTGNEKYQQATLALPSIYQSQ